MRNRTFLIAIFLLINGFIFSEKVHLEMEK